MAASGLKRLAMPAVLGAAALLLVAVAALAVVPPLNATYTGTSKHKHYLVQVNTQCASQAPCHRTQVITLQVGPSNSQKAPGGPCGYGYYQLAPGKLHKGKFSESGVFIANNRDVAFKASGQFRSRKLVTGKITGPKRCGGTDGFRATLYTG